MKAGSAAFGVPRTDFLSLKAASLRATSPPEVPRKIASCPWLPSSRFISARRWATGLLRRDMGLQAGADLGLGIVVVLARQIGDVPLGRQLHALDAAPLDRVGDERLRLAGAGRRQTAESRQDGIEVVTVEELGFPAEGAETHVDRLHPHHRLGDRQ